MPQGWERGILPSGGKEHACIGNGMKGGWQAMAEDREHEHTLRRQVAQMVALEGDIEGTLEHQLEKGQAHPETAAAVRQCHEMASSHREALEAHLKRLGGDSTEPTETAAAALFGAVGEADSVRT